MELREILEAVQVGEALQWKNLQVFALTQPNGHVPAYALIDDLLDSRLVEISEVGDGGTVPTITVRNEADVDALILDGTELRGAKQNRMVNITVVAGKHALTPHDVAGVGSYFAVRGPGVAGGGVVHGGRVVHVALFPETH